MRTHPLRCPGLIHAFGDKAAAIIGAIDKVSLVVDGKSLKDARRGKMRGLGGRRSPISNAGPSTHRLHDPQDVRLVNLRNFRKISLHNRRSLCRRRASHGRENGPPLTAPLGIAMLGTI
jgi:hypothetical protein